MLRNRFLTRRNSWNELARLQHEMNRLFDSAPSRTNVYRAPRYPAMNVWTNEDGAVLTAELPGCSPDNLDISVVNEMLTLSGQRAPEDVPEGATYQRRERNCGSFSRTFQLPFQVDATQVEAVFENGVLEVTLPRAEADKPRKIAIQAG